MILAQCGSCDSQLKFSDDSIGKQIKCPNCGNMVELPAIAVAKPVAKSKKEVEDTPREITTESLIDIDVSNNEDNPGKYSGDNEYYAKHRDEIEGTDVDDEYLVDTPVPPDRPVALNPHPTDPTQLNQPIADPYSGTLVNPTPVPGNPYPTPPGVAPPPGALPTFEQYQANKPVQAQPVQAQPVQAQPVQAQPVQAQPVQAQPVQAQPVQAQPVQAQPVQAQPVQAQPVQAQPVQAQPVQAQPVQAQPVQAQPVQAQPVQAQPVQAQPVQAQPVQAQPVQAQPVQAQPVQAQPVQAQPVQAQPVQAQPVQAQSVQAQPVQAQPVQEKPIPIAPIVSDPAKIKEKNAGEKREAAINGGEPTQKIALENQPKKHQTKKPECQKTVDALTSKELPIGLEKLNQSKDPTAAKDGNDEEDCLTLLRDSTDSKSHDGGLLDDHLADDSSQPQDSLAEAPITPSRNTKSPNTKSPNTKSRNTKSPNEKSPNAKSPQFQTSSTLEKSVSKEASDTKSPAPAPSLNLKQTSEAKTAEQKTDKAASDAGTNTAAIPKNNAAAQLVKSQPAKSQPAKSQPAKSQPAKSQPAKSQPANSQPAKSQPVKAETVKAETVKAETVDPRPVQATLTTEKPVVAEPVPVTAQAVPITSTLPIAIPAQAVAIGTPNPVLQPATAAETTPQPAKPDQPQLDTKPKFGEKKSIKLTPGVKKAVLFGGIGAALVLAVLFSLVLIQNVITSGPDRAFLAYKAAVKNNDFAALYEIVDSATRDTLDNYADAKAKESPVDYSLRGKEKFVAVATRQFESSDAAKRKTNEERIQRIEQAAIVSESINRNRASVQVKFENEATELITFEKIDGEWKIGIPSFSLLFVEY